MTLAYSHAVMHANRPFLLRNIRPTSDQEFGNSRAISDCLSAAKKVLQMVDEMAQDGTLFHAFWWTHYVTFCSLTVVYVWAIQRSSSGTSEAGSLDFDGVDLFGLAESCQRHLAEATASSSPSRRYSIILEELRQEALGRPTRQIEHLSHNNGLEPEIGRLEPNVDAVTGFEGAAAMTGFAAPPSDSFATFSGFRDNWQTTDWLDIDSLVRLGAHFRWVHTANRLETGLWAIPWFCSIAAVMGWAADWVYASMKNDTAES